MKIRDLHLGYKQNAELMIKTLLHGSDGGEDLPQGTFQYGGKKNLISTVKLYKMIFDQQGGEKTHTLSRCVLIPAHHILLFGHAL